jgi:hypothetical protein
MTQPFTDALSWVPKTRALGASLGRAHDLARAQGHAAVTLEHLLSALIEDPDASAVLLSCNVDLLKLNNAANSHLLQQPAAGGAAPEAAAPVLTIFEYAVAASRQSKRNEVNGAIVLAAMVGEGNSVAARLLQAQGLTFEGAVQALKRATSQPARPTASAVPPPAALQPAQPPAQQPTTSPAPTVQAPDEDPVTTARRRIEAMRSGQAVPPMVPAPPAVAPPVQAASPVAIAPAPAPSQPAPAQVIAQPEMPAAIEPPGASWAPPPVPQQHVVPPVRQPRMPPPIPPLASPQPRTSGPAIGVAQAAAPWTDPNAISSRPEPATATVIPFPANRAGMPIDPARLVDKLPRTLKTGSATTVEVRIARSAVHATATAMGAAPDAALTRALTVRLKAPAGGILVETAAPETQWFDVRNTGRDDEEVRWRWIVTPHAAGSHPLQLTISMRTLASDGVAIETTLPEQQASARVVRPLSATLITAATLAGAAACGALAMFLANGGLGSILRAFG